MQSLKFTDRSPTGHLILLVKAGSGGSCHPHGPFPLSSPLKGSRLGQGSNPLSCPAPAVNLFIAGKVLRAGHLGVGAVYQGAQRDLNRCHPGQVWEASGTEDCSIRQFLPGHWEGAPMQE